MRLKLELQDARTERQKVDRVVDDLARADVRNRREDMDILEKELEKWKARASYFEREYKQAKQPPSSGEVTSQPSASAERSSEAEELAKQKKALMKTLETKVQEMSDLRDERDDVQKQLDSLQSMGNYFQEKYKNAANELQVLREEHGASAATADRLKTRVSVLQQENEGLKSANGKPPALTRIGSADPGQVERNDRYLRDLQQKLLRKDEEVEQAQARFKKSQVLNDCLNTLLALVSDQTTLYETSVQLTDVTLRSQIDAKKAKAQAVISRLNDLMSEEDDRTSRPALAYLHYGSR
eukprot:NODE_13682_length_1152_cov_4.418537.p1 GENE.NODE_13682_length_1152_cov_4.418537~~NODE_13682_length_1152_cov_4.418537.p1  ORF type:complete len:297 (+),score=124.93 NODE_13682_length_1152_cov_4.418537:238-1128(+)